MPTVGHVAIATFAIGGTTMFLHVCSRVSYFLCSLRFVAIQAQFVNGLLQLNGLFRIAMRVVACSAYYTSFPVPRALKQFGELLIASSFRRFGINEILRKVVTGHITRVINLIRNIPTIVCVASILRHYWFTRVTSGKARLHINLELLV